MKQLEWILDPLPDDPHRDVIGQFIVPSHETLDDGAKVMGIRFSAANEQAKVRVEGDLAPDIAFGAGEYMVSLADVRHLALFMNRCLERLGTLFVA